MPNDKRYPADWKSICSRIRERAGNRCEWCRVPGDDLILRLPGSVDWYAWEAIETRSMNSTEAASIGLYDAVLVTPRCSVVHLGTDFDDGSPADPYNLHDCRDENLAYLCALCRRDFEQVTGAAQRRSRLARVAAGQMPLGMELVQ